MGSHTIPGVSDPHGAAQHTNITREVYLPVREGHVAIGTAELETGWPVVTGAANADGPLVVFTMQVPDDFVSFTSVMAVWFSHTSGGNVYWRLTATYAASTEAIGTHTDSPALAALATGGTDIKNVQEPVNPLTLASLAIGDTIRLSFDRDGSDAADTLGAEIHLLGLLFTYIANQ